MAAHYLTDDDVAILKEVVHSIRHNRLGKSRTSPLVPPTVGTETYVALTPAGGVPALTEGPDAGATKGAGDVPGSAYCDIYTMVTAVDGTRSLWPLSKQELVYNIGAVVSGNVWAVIERDKGGDWWVVKDGSSSSGGAFVAHDDSDIVVPTTGIQFPDGALDQPGLDAEVQMVGLTNPGLIGDPILTYDDSTPGSEELTLNNGRFSIIDNEAFHTYHHEFGFQQTTAYASLYADLNLAGGILLDATLISYLTGGPSEQNLFILDMIGNGANDMAYAIRRSGVDKVGVDGTTGGSDTVVGGIVTALGTAGYTGSLTLSHVVPNTSGGYTVTNYTLNFTNGRLMTVT